MKISARNILRGKIKTIVSNVVDAEVVVELPGGQEVVAVVTQSSVKRLGLRRCRGLRHHQGQQRHAGRRLERIIFSFPGRQRFLVELLLRLEPHARC